MSKKIQLVLLIIEKLKLEKCCTQKNNKLKKCHKVLDPRARFSGTVLDLRGPKFKSR